MHAQWGHRSCVCVYYQMARRLEERSQRRRNAPSFHVEWRGWGFVRVSPPFCPCCDRPERPGFSHTDQPIHNKAALSSTVRRGKGWAALARVLCG